MTWEVRNTMSDLGHGKQCCTTSGGGRAEPDGGGDSGNLCLGRGGGDLRHVGIGRTVATSGRAGGGGQFARDAVGHAAHLSEASHDQTPKKAGVQGWSRGKSPAAAGAD